MQRQRGTLGCRVTRPCRLVAALSRSKLREGPAKICFGRGKLVAGERALAACTVTYGHPPSLYLPRYLGTYPHGCLLGLVRIYFSRYTEAGARRGYTRVRWAVAQVHHRSGTARVLSRGGGQEVRGSRAGSSRLPGRGEPVYCVTCTEYLLVASDSNRVLRAVGNAYMNGPRALRMSLRGPFI